MVLLINKNPSTFNSQKWKLAACVLFGFTSLILAIIVLIVDPIKIVTRYYTRVTPDSVIYKLLQKDLDGIFISVKLFNTTNSDRFIKGLDDKLKLEEVGPFTYSETRVNDDMAIDMEAGTLKYTPRLIKKLVRNQSIGYPEDFNITMPNLPMLGLASLMSTFSAFPRMGFNILTRQLASKPMVTIDAKSYLWGYHEPLVKLAYTLAPGVINFDKIGVMDRLYGANVKNNLVVSVKDETKMMIQSRNGHKKLTRDGTQNPEECELCDSFENTYEGMLYPALTPDTPIRLFRAGVCKIFDMVFNEQKIFNNSAVGYVYRLKNNFFSTNGVENGLFDLSECAHGLPLTISKPHFKGVQPKIYEKIEGMRPEEVKEDVYIVIEPLMGLEMATYVSLQANIALGDLSFNSEARRFSNMVVPICIIEIRQEELNEEANLVLKQLYVIAPILVLCMRISLMVLTILFFAYSLKLYLDSRNELRSAILFPMMFSGEKPKLIAAEVPLLYGENSR